MNVKRPISLQNCKSFVLRMQEIVSRSFSCVVVRCVCSLDTQDLACPIPDPLFPLFSCCAMCLLDMDMELLKGEMRTSGDGSRFNRVSGERDQREGQRHFIGEPVRVSVTENRSAGSMQ